jgi:hypothetical protein
MNQSRPHIKKTRESARQVVTAGAGLMSWGHWIPVPRLERRTLVPLVTAGPREEPETSALRGVRYVYGGELTELRSRLSGAWPDNKAPTDGWKTFQLRHQLFSLGEDFWIQNAGGENVY